jgi:hypothetical protein
MCFDNGSLIDGTAITIILCYVLKTEMKGGNMSDEQGVTWY